MTHKLSSLTWINPGTFSAFLKLGDSLKLATAPLYKYVRICE